MGLAEGNQEWRVGTNGERPETLQGPCYHPAAVGVASLPDQDGLTHPQVELTPRILELSWGRLASAAPHL